MERKPILLSKNTVAWIQIFEKTDNIEDVMFGIFDNMDDAKVWEDAAREFISQLKWKTAPRFWRQLVKEIDIFLKELG